MKFELNTFDDRISIKIKEELTVYGAEELRNELLTCMKKEQAAISLDLSEIENCDTIGIQLLLSARQSADKAGKSLTINRISATVTEAADRIGINLGEVFGIKEEAKHAEDNHDSG